jgi:hypothetical protein
MITEATRTIEHDLANLNRFDARTSLYPSEVRLPIRRKSFFDRRPKATGVNFY